MDNYIFGQQILATCLPRINLQKMHPEKRTYLTELQKKEEWTEKDFSFLLEIQNALLQKDIKGTVLNPYYMNIKDVFFKDNHTIFYVDKNGKEKPFSTYESIWDKDTWPEIFFWLFSSSRKNNIFPFDHEDLTRKIDTQEKRCGDFDQTAISFFWNDTFIVERINLEILFSELEGNYSKRGFCDLINSLFIKNNFNIFYTKYLQNDFLDTDKQKEPFFSTVTGKSFFKLLSALPVEYREQFWLLMSYIEGEITSVHPIIEIDNDERSTINYKDELFSRKFGDGLFSCQIEFEDGTICYHNDNKILPSLTQEEFNLLMLNDEIGTQDPNFTDNEKDNFLQKTKTYFSEIILENVFIKNEDQKRGKVKRDNPKIKKIHFPTTTLVLYCAFMKRENLLSAYLQEYGDRIVEPEGLVKMFHQYTEICTTINEQNKIDHDRDFLRKEQQQQQIVTLEQVHDLQVEELMRKQEKIKQNVEKRKIKTS